MKQDILEGRELVYNASTIADWFLCNVDREAGESITHLKLQKLLYYAQAWFLVLSKDGNALFSDGIEAWTHGPVIRSIYTKYNEYGFQNIPAPNGCDSLQIDEEASDILKEVYRVYGKYDAKYLEKLTHQEEPWRKTRGDLPEEARCTNEIDLNAMKKFYADMYESQ